MTQAIKDLRQRLGEEAIKASEAHSPRVVIDAQDLPMVLAALDELIEPAEKREVTL